MSLIVFRLTTGCQLEKNLPATAKNGGRTENGRETGVKGQKGRAARSLHFCYNLAMELPTSPETSSEDSLFIAKVLRARRIPPEKKFMAGARLYEYKRGIMMAAIRAAHPNATPAEQRALYQHRLKITKILDENPHVR